MKIYKIILSQRESNLSLVSFFEVVPYKVWCNVVFLMKLFKNEYFVNETEKNGNVYIF